MATKCTHPPTRLYTWTGYDGTLCVACCDCGGVLKGALEVVDDGDECPRCGEFRMDRLVWAEDDSHVECATCGHHYLPGAEDAINRDSHGLEGFVPDGPDDLE